MIKICYVIPSLGMGGTERQLVHLVRGLARDFDISVVCTRLEGALAGDVRKAGANVRVVPVSSGWDFRFRGRLGRFLCTHRPEILHTFLFGFDYFANKAARDAGVPVVISSRRQLATWKKPRHVFIQRRANRHVDAIVANSRAVAEFAASQESADPALYRVIPNGINPSEFIATPDLHVLRLRYKIPFHRRVVGIVANFSPVKDHRLFVATARELLRRRADVHFLMVGDGPLVAAIEKAIQAGGAADCFTRISTVSEVPDLYALMDVSVLCSEVEGFPNAVLESMAVGKPVVAPAVGGICELIRDGETGRLIQTRNPADFADAISALLDDPDSACRMGKRAADEISAKYTVTAMVDAYRALYAELLARKRAEV